MPKNTYNARALITSFTKITQSFNFGHSRMKMHARITWFNNYFLGSRKNEDLSKDMTINKNVINLNSDYIKYRKTKIYQT